MIRDIPVSTLVSLSRPGAQCFVACSAGSYERLAECWRERGDYAPAGVSRAETLEVVSRGELISCLEIVDWTNPDEVEFLLQVMVEAASEDTRGVIEGALPLARLLYGLMTAAGRPVLLASIFRLAELPLVGLDRRLRLIARREGGQTGSECEAFLLRGTAEREGARKVVERISALLTEFEMQNIWLVIMARTTPLEVSLGGGLHVVLPDESAPAWERFAARLSIGCILASLTRGPVSRHYLLLEGSAVGECGPVLFNRLLRLGTAADQLQTF